ncbi:MAG: hypothetical protein ACSLE6_01905 [Mycobacterium sp.]
MGEIFLGNEALGSGMTRQELRRWYRPLFRGVYIPKNAVPTLSDRTRGAWLASGQQGVVAGVAASALHGAAHVDRDQPIEILVGDRRKQPGLIVRSDRLLGDEVIDIDDLPVTTAARTAYDLGRLQRRYAAIARLDALMAVAPFTDVDVIDLLHRYGPARGIRQLRELLPLVDPKSESPKESWLRLQVIDWGFPRPDTQMDVGDGNAFLDMGWRLIKLALEYDGEGHQTNREQYVKDRRRLPMIERRGWEVINVIKEDDRSDVYAQLHEAFVRRGGPETYEMVDSSRTNPPKGEFGRKWAA